MEDFRTSSGGNNNNHNDNDNNTNTNTNTINNKKADEKVFLEGLKDNFSRVQRILDENRVLIGEINQNHESKMPENLSRNVVLIKELSSNIAQVVDLYTDMSSSFLQGMDEQFANGNNCDNEGSLLSNHEDNHEQTVQGGIEVRPKKIKAQLIEVAKLE